MSYNNTFRTKVWKQDTDPGVLANNDDIWLQTTGGGVTVLNMQLRYGGAWFLSPTVPVNTDSVTQGVTNFYMSGATLIALFSGTAHAWNINTAPKVNAGYQKLPGGFIMQWGDGVPVTATGSQVITLPLTYVMSNLVLVSCYYPTADTVTNATFQVITSNTSTVTVYCQNDVATWTSPVTPRVLTFGY